MIWAGDGDLTSTLPSPTTVAGRMCQCRKWSCRASNTGAATAAAAAAVAVAVAVAAAAAVVDAASQLTTIHPSAPEGYCGRKSG